MADAHQLQQVLVNLINYAQQAMLSEGDGGCLLVETRREPEGSGGRETILVAVPDDGPGVPGHLREKIFDPFFTTKEAGEGTGLGLSLSYGTVQEHGETCELRARRAGGARFEMRLPILRAAALKSGRQDEAAAEHAPIVDLRRILVVDEEPRLREMLNDVLAGDGHAIEEAADGLQARDGLHAPHPPWQGTVPPN